MADLVMFNLEEPTAEVVSGGAVAEVIPPRKTEDTVRETPSKTARLESNWAKVRLARQASMFVMPATTPATQAAPQPLGSINESEQQAATLLPPPLAEVRKASVAQRISSIFGGNGARSSSMDSSKSNEKGRGRNKLSHREEIEYYYNKCMVTLSHSFNIIKAMMMRVVFSLHSFIAIVYVFFVKKDEWYFLNFLGVVFLMIEMFVTIVKRKGREPRWYYATPPPICVMFMFDKFNFLQTKGSFRVFSFTFAR
jgi:hypothetical protein